MLPHNDPGFVSLLERAWRLGFEDGSSGYADTEPYNDNPNATHWFRKVLTP